MILRPPNTRKKRQAPKEWRAVILEACQLPNYAKTGFGYSEVLDIASRHGISIGRESLRVKIDRYRRNGYVKKVSRGRFQVPVTGYDFFGALEHQ